jgi:hypothetical protein
LIHYSSFCRPFKALLELVLPVLAGEIRQTGDSSHG